MSAKWMKPRNSASSFSEREKMRRKPFSRRNSRQIGTIWAMAALAGEAQKWLKSRYLRSIPQPIGMPCGPMVRRHRRGFRIVVDRFPRTAGELSRDRDWVERARRLAQLPPSRPAWARRASGVSRSRSTPGLLRGTSSTWSAFSPISDRAPTSPETAAISRK